MTANNASDSGFAPRESHSPEDPLARRIQSIHESFQDAPRRHAPLPYWFWNADLRESELLSQLQSIYESGCAGAIIYPRHGLRTAYLSAEWFRLVGVVLEKARELGLEMWLADSENWPGGVGPDPEEAYYLKIVRHLVSHAEPAQFDIVGEILAACAFPVPGEQDAGLAELSDLTDMVADSRLEWTAPDARRWQVILFTSVRYLHADALSEGAGERFIASTHARYEEALGSLHAAGVRGFYTDEFAPVSVWNVPDPGALPWTPALRDDLILEGDPSLLPSLLPLAVQTAAPWPRRLRYWSALTERLCRCFFEPISRWLEDRRLLWGGHFLFEEPLISQVTAQGNLPRLMRYLEMPTVDSLMLRPADATDNVAAGSHAGSGPCCLAVEAFGGAGWGTDLLARRRCFDGHLSRGADRLIPHGLFYSSAGKRKLENPPSEFFREPFAPEYPVFAGHVMRSTWAMNQGRAAARVAVVYPLLSAWLCMTIGEDAPLARIVENDFYQVCTLLDSLQWEYEVIPDDQLWDAEIEDGGLRIGAHSFPVIVLPSTPFLPRAGWKKLLEFYEAGGQLLCLGLPPEGFEDGPDAEQAAFLMKLAAIDVDILRRAYLTQANMPIAGADTYSFTRKSAAGGRFRTFPAALATDPEFARGEVRQILASFCPPDVECRSADVRIRRRVLGGLDFYWIFSAASDPVEVRLSFRGHGAPEIWHTDTGRREPLMQFTWVGADTTLVTLTLQPEIGLLVGLIPEERPHVDFANFHVEAAHLAGDSIRVEGWGDPTAMPSSELTPFGDSLALWSGGGQTFRVEGPPPPAPQTLALDAGWSVERLDANVLVLDNWRFRRDERGGGRILGWHRRPHPDWELLPAHEPLTWFPPLEPVESQLSSYVWYQSQFVVQEWTPGTRIWLVLEKIDVPMQCWINGEEMRLEFGATPGGRAPGGVSTVLSDPGYAWVDIASMVGTGHFTVALLADCRGAVVRAPTNRNRITVDLAPMPARLAGDFRVMARPKGKAIASTEIAVQDAGSWTEYGYPHYSGVMSYRRSLTIPMEWATRSIWLELGDAQNSARISMDGRHAGVLLGHPFHLDVSSRVQPGREAALEILIANTSVNALIGKPAPSGLIGPVRLRAFPRVQLQST